MKIKVTHKLCECGCGKITNLAPYTNKTIGYIKGIPIRFIYGHNLKIHHFNPWGGLNINWKGNDALPQSGHIRARKRFQLGKCELCNKFAFDRHHKDLNPLNNNKENVQLLCRSCHMKIDCRLDKLHKKKSKNNVMLSMQGIFY